MSSADVLAPWLPAALDAASAFGPQVPAMLAAPDGTWRLADLSLGAEALDAEDAERAAVRSGAEDAYARGRADGARDATLDAERQMQPAFEAIARVAECLTAAQAQFERDRERNVHALALAVARKLIQRELSADPALLQGLVARALELLPRDSAIEVHLHPDDLAAIAEPLGGAVPPEGAPIRWAADGALQRGDFLIDSALRIVDGRTDVALRELWERLDDA